MGEKFLINTKNFTTERTNFESFLTYINKMREVNFYGVSLNFIDNTLKNVKVIYGDNEGVEQLIRDWYTNISTHPLYSILINSFYFFDANGNKFAEIFYCNDIISNLIDIKIYFMRGDLPFNESALFPLEVYEEAKKSYYDLRNFLQKAITISNNKMISEFEIMNASNIANFQKTIKEAELILTNMKKIINDVEMKGDPLKLTNENKEPYYQLKEILKLASSKFTY